MTKRGMSNHEKELEEWIRPELERHRAASEERIAAEVETRVLRRVSSFLDRLESEARRRRRVTIGWWLGLAALIILLSGLGWQSLEEIRTQRRELGDLRALTAGYSQELEALQTELNDLRTRTRGYSRELASLQTEFEHLGTLTVRSMQELEDLRGELEELRAALRRRSDSGSTDKPF